MSLYEINSAQTPGVILGLAFQPMSLVLAGKLEVFLFFLVITKLLKRTLSPLGPVSPSEPRGPRSPWKGM